MRDQLSQCICERLPSIPFSSLKVSQVITVMAALAVIIPVACLLSWQVLTLLLVRSIISFLFSSLGSYPTALPHTSICDSITLTEGPNGKHSLSSSNDIFDASFLLLCRCSTNPAELRKKFYNCRDFWLRGSVAKYNPIEEI